jgi:glyoxylase-like metal-dependent hydrolase (beta-lactamase superfamily II)
MPPEFDAAALPATRATLERIAALDIGVVIPGHGEPFDEVAPALARAFRRVEAFEADTERIARHAVKVILAFTLLDRQRVPIAELPAYFERVEIYRDFNARFFRLPARDFAEWLVGDLVKSGAARCEAGYLLPA